MYKLVPLKELFTPIYGVNLELINVQECSKEDEGSIRFISRTEHNNGLSAYVKIIDDVIPNPAHTISVAGSGSVLASFYQDEPYYSGRDLYYLIPKKVMSKEEMMFYAICIRANKYKYNYGRAANRTLGEITVPNKMPDNFNSISINAIPIPSEKPLFHKPIELDINNWKYFSLNKLFQITGTKTTPLIELKGTGVGKYPYVTTQATNNGVEGFYDYNTDNGGVLTVDSAVLGYCSYQALKFSASDHVEKLIPNFPMNKYIALFLVTIINKEQYRYNYGRKAAQIRLKKAAIKLPDANGEPNFEFMENYIKSLPYSASL